LSRTGDEVRRGFRASHGLALVVSLTLHGLLLGLLASVTEPASPAPATPLAVDCVMLSSDPLADWSGQPGRQAGAESAPAEDPWPSRELLMPATVLEPRPVGPSAACQPAAVAAQPGAGAAGGGNGAGGNGPPSFFQVPAHGQSIVFVIDRSVSMALNGGLAAAKRELLASLEQLPPTTRFQVILYNRAAVPLTVGGQTGLLPAGDDTRREVARVLAPVRGEGGTDHLQALKCALRLQPDVIFLVTDADDLTAEQVRLVTRLNGDHTIIHAIELRSRPSPPAGSPLQVLAQNNRGNYRSVDLLLAGVPR
jgi:von Willebrand factor type A domain